MASSSARAESNGARVLVLSGPSGAGKTTVVNHLIDSSPVPLAKAISATTRPARPHEEDKRDYYFLELDEFLKRKAAGEFLETAEVHRSGHWYGTLKSEVDRAHDAGAWSLLEIDIEGARAVREKYPNCVFVFLRTSSLAEFEQRLRSRGTEAEEVIQRRLETAKKELAAADEYDFQVINDKVERAVGEIVGILQQHEAEIDAGSV
ncbi:guanylate kinase [Calycomorphotria hydatis]|nr:guanylate kinase [Calycomorphotria hydatis]